MEDSADYEDAGLELAKRDRMTIEARIVELEQTLPRAVIIEPASVNANRVAHGAIVVLIDERSGRELRVRLVSPLEASIPSGDLPGISHDSPVGSQLLGRTVGEAFSVTLPKGTVTYRVKHVES